MATKLQWAGRWGLFLWRSLLFASVTMFVALLAQPAASWHVPTTLPAAGHATYYADGVMEAVWSYRIREGDVGACPNCIGAVAMLHAADVGRIVWVEHDDEILGPFMVVDCAAAQDFPTLVRRGTVVEVPYWVAQRWEMAGPVDVRVLDRPPHGQADN